MAIQTNIVVTDDGTEVLVAFERTVQETMDGVTLATLTGAQKVEDSFNRIKNQFSSGRQRIGLFETRTQTLQRNVSDAFREIGRAANRGLNNLNQQLDRLNSKLKENLPTLKQTRTSVNNIGGAFFNLKTAIAALGLGLVTKSIFDTAESMQSLRGAINAAAGGAEEGGRQFAFVEAQARAIGPSP